MKWFAIDDGMNLPVPIHTPAASVEAVDGSGMEEPAVVAALANLAACGIALRPTDTWLPNEVVMVADAMVDLLRVASWTTLSCQRALGGPITLIRDRDHPIVTDAHGTRFPVLGLYDTTQRTLTVNNWSFDARTGGKEGGKRILLHELAHAWDKRSHHGLSLVLQWLPGPRASDYARVSRFEDWAEAVMATVYGADAAHSAFNHPRALRRHYVRCAFWWCR